MFKSFSILLVISDLMGKPSELFIDVMYNIGGSGSQVVECELCGRTYFTEEGDWEEKRFEEFRKLAKEQPDKYIEVDDFSSWRYIDRRQAVLDCKCNKLADYESLFWENREIIIPYLLQRSEAEFKEKEEDHRRAQQLKELKK